MIFSFENVFELYAVKHKNLLFLLIFLFIGGSDTEMLQTCYNFPVLFP